MRLFGTYLYKHQLAMLFFGCSVILTGWEAYMMEFYVSGFTRLHLGTVALVALTLSYHLRMQSRRPIRRKWLLALAYVVIAAAAVSLVVI
ncbi:MAG: hypothetical protein KDD36_09135 [Flavobacteriales bacterium]|nr:hypothetical protein [Flavobacteriales bacterium]